MRQFALWQRVLSVVVAVSIAFQLVAPGFAMAQGGGWLSDDDWDSDEVSNQPLQAAPISPGEVTGSPSSPGIQAPSGEEAVQWIGPSGGTLSISSATLVIPAGALGRAVEIRMSEVPAPVDLDGSSMAFVAAPMIRLEPEGTRFNRPVTLRMNMPAAILSGYRRGEDLRAWLLTGSQAIPMEEFRVDSQGRLVIEVNHFSGMLYGLLALTAVVIFAGVLGRMTASTNPHLMITPQGADTRRFTLSGGRLNSSNVRLPATMNQSGPTPMFINKGFNLTNSSMKNINSGDTLLAPSGPSRANCADLTSASASILLAQPDSRFHAVIGVWGRYPNSKTDNKAERKRGANHIWLEAKIDGKVYVLDTTRVKRSGNGIELMFYPKEELTSRYGLIPMKEFGYGKPLEKYVGLQPDAGHDTDAAYSHGFDLGCRHRRYDEHADKDGIVQRYNQQDPALGAAFMQGWNAGNLAPQCQRGH